MPKSLLSLLRHAENVSVISGDPEKCLVEDLCIDSRKARPGSLFLALAGTHRAGTDFISHAVEQGAIAVMVPLSHVELAKKAVPRGVLLLGSKDPRVALGRIADAFYGHPSSLLKVIGITGTNGKTTCTFILEKILSASGARCGLSGTIMRKTCTASRTSSLTTPDAISFHGFLASVAKEKAEFAVTEVSSHGLMQGRVEGCRFELAVFTNLSHDHLDYHGDMEGYFQAKRLFFTRYKPGAAVINLDDKWGSRLWNEYQGHKVSYGFSRNCTVFPEDFQITPSGIEAAIKIKGRVVKISSSLIGRHNLYNILASIAAAYVLGIRPEHIKKGIEALKNVPGRLERVDSPKGVTALVDYAHTPHALQNVLEGLGSLKSGRLITVVGCGGDRDRTKRPEMAKIAAELSDMCIFTSDNPRTESAEAILKDMLEGPDPELMKKVEVVKDRRKAIFKAASLARPGDILLVAGKGHEDYQIIGKTRFPFDDRKVLKEALNATGNPSERLLTEPSRKGKMDIELGQLANILGGKVISGNPETAFSSVCTDSRTIKAGQLFWALKGENFDGHAFVLAASERKAAGAVVEYEPAGLPAGFPLLRVKDSLASLGDLAAWYRTKIGCNVFAITGSCGKTTTKELVLAILKGPYKALGTRGNFNNLIGLPLTILSLAPDTQWAVLEMGTNLPGEIERLCQVARPDAGLITCIRPVHMEGLGTLENISKEKAALFRSLPEHGTAVVNLDDPLVIRHLPHVRCKHVTGYTCHDAARDDRVEKLVVLKNMAQAKQGMDVTLDICGQVTTVRSRLFGRVNALNILAAAAAGAALGIDATLIRKGIETVQASPGRMHARNLAKGWLLLDDSYNANPSSVKAAMDVACDITKGASKTFILGDMLELGPRANEFHRQTGESAAACSPDLLLTVGKLAKHIARGALEAGLSANRIFPFESTDELLKWMAEDPEGFFNGTRRTVLVKASRGMGLDQVARYLEKRLEEET